MSIDNQRAVSELLRSADKAIKDGNLDNALAAISKVFEFDQRNVYARAYQERILSLKEMQLAARANAEKIPADSEKKVQESNFSPSKTVSHAVKETAPVETAHPEKMDEAEAEPASGQKEPAVTPLPGPAQPGQPVDGEDREQPSDTEQPAAEQASDTEQPAAEQPAAVEQPETAAPPQPESLTGVSAGVFDYVKHTPARLEAYKSLLAEIWEKGIFTDVEEQRILAIRHSFAVTDEEHKGIERDIRFAAYMTAIELAWKKGVTSFDEMRKMYHITDKEHLQIEGRVFRLLQSLRSVGTVLLIDDEPDFLQIVSRQLTEAGYYCVAVPTCEEALFVLESLAPNIVVCDVNFAKPNMSGFAFYEKFRVMEKFLSVPFIFLSGMMQEAVQRTGLQMGADSYFTKPIDLELFIATIEGKIKRSFELQQRLTPHHL